MVFITARVSGSAPPWAYTCQLSFSVIDSNSDPMIGYPGDDKSAYVLVPQGFSGNLTSSATVLVTDLSAGDFYFIPQVKSTTGDMCNFEPTTLYVLPQ